MDERVRSRLRTFGLVLAALLAFCAWRWGTKGWAVASWTFGAAGLSALAALVRPELLAPIRNGLIAVGRANAAVVLLLLYYLVLVPYGLAVKMFSGDPLDRARENTSSYWKRRTSGEDLSSYERQF